MSGSEPASETQRRTLRLRGVNPAATADRALSEATARAWIREFEAPTTSRRTDVYEVAPVERGVG